MKKVIALAFLVLFLVLTGCKGTPTDQQLDSVEDSEIYLPQQGDITLLVELRTSSTWSELKFLNPDLILSVELTSLIGEPAYSDLDGSGLFLDQSPEDAENGEQVGLIARLILDESAADATLDFDLTKGCPNQSLVSLYGVVEDEPRLIYQRELNETDDCGGVAFDMAMAGRLEAMEKIGSTGYAKEEVEFVDLNSPTIENGIELELISRSHFTTLSIVDAELPQIEILAQVGEPTDLSHGEVIVIDMHQPESEAQLGKWMGVRMRLGFDPEDRDQTLDLAFQHGCNNETILAFYKVVDGERIPIRNIDHNYSSTIFECTDPIPIQIDLDHHLVPLRHYVLENILLDEGDLTTDGQIFLEAELVTNSNWAEIFSDDDRIISSQLMSVSGDPKSVTVRMDTLHVAQPNSAAGSALDVGVVARFGFLPQDEDNKISFLLQNGALNQAAVRFYANQNGKRTLIPIEAGQDSITVYGFEAQDFILDLDTVQAVIKAAELYDDLPMVAYLSDITGEVMVRQPGMQAFYPAREGGPVNVGGEVLTGANAEVYLTVSDGAVIRLGSNTIFGLEMGINSEEIILPRFRLELGEMEVVSGSGGFLIYTPSSVVGAIGSAALVTVSADGVADLDCLAGDCFLYDGTAATEGVKEDLPDSVAAVLDVVGVQLDLAGTVEIDVDADDDGIPDKLDLCPEEGDHGFGLDAQGCPNPAPQDWDGDGVPDYRDRCPTIYAPIDDEGHYLLDYGCPDGDLDFNGIPDDNECVAGEECLDRDGDGVPDYIDACPGIPWTPSDAVFQQSDDTNGCLRGDADRDGIPDDLECVDCTPPDGYPSSLDDSDGDGVPDGMDYCPDQGDAGNGVYGNFTSNQRGCPKPPTVSDLDGDGVPDEDDICVDLGDAGYGVDLTGCPIPPMESDLDGDGVPDEDDICVDLGDAGYGVDLSGCPIPPIDSDLDGYPDLDDYCSQEGDLGYGVDFRGCPILYVPYITQDWDGDGFADDVDRCPTIYAPSGPGLHSSQAPGVEGCPAGDNDFDGVPDELECEGMGCSDWDGDGVNNESDRCPYNYYVNTTSGCPNQDLNFDGIPDDLVCEDCVKPDTADCVDQDQDGICNDRDVCPLVAGNLTNLGCPPLSNDYDNDGWPNEGDFCPTIYSPDEQNHGCPPGDFDFDGVPDEHSSHCVGDDPELGCQDRDGDGVDDSIDGCPDVWTEDNSPIFQMDVDDPVAHIVNFGCPNYGHYEGYDPATYPDPVDSDGDGIIDALDQCPSVYAPGGYDPDDSGYLLAGCPPGDYDNDGIPDPEVCNDTDQDGLCDSEDDCPFEAGSLVNKGCKEGDSDGDGVRDGVDLCPGAVDPLRGVTPLGCPKVAVDRSQNSGTETTVYQPNQNDLTAGLIDVADQDSDGFADDYDKCPKQGDQGHGLGRDGCPLDPPQDSDGDGINDTQDECPNQGDSGSGLRENGCPKAERAVTDPDGDGIIGALDKCPNQGGDVGRNGCPKKDDDSDGDGVPDSSDNCPNQGSEGYGINRKGCPLKPPDSDGDGLPDNQDKCPNKGDLGHGLNAQGCPKPAPEKPAQPPQPDTSVVPEPPEEKKEEPPAERAAPTAVPSRPTAPPPEPTAVPN